jgi:transcriptional regulator with XRE-family HTH domain
MMIPPNNRSVDAVAARLKLVRKTLGLSQKAFCERAGIAANTYNQWEKGRGRPDLDYGQRICDAYKLTLDFLYNGDPAGLPHNLAVAYLQSQMGQSAD